MKRVFLILAALAAWTAAAATPNRTATEAYVANKIAAAVAELPAPDYSTNNTELVETIRTTAPAPDLSGYLPKSGGTLTGSLHIKTGANEMLDLYNDDPYLFGRVTVDWLIHEDGPSTLSLWDRFRNIHYDFPTNGGTVAMVENFPTKVSAFTNDAGYLTGYTETDPAFSNFLASGGEVRGVVYFFVSPVVRTESGKSSYFTSTGVGVFDHGTTYTLTYPQKNGTFALTSDIPAVPDVSNYYTKGETAGAVSNIVTTALVRERLGVYLYVGEDGGIYVHTQEN